MSDVKALLDLIADSRLYAARELYNKLLQNKNSNVS